MFKKKRALTTAVLLSCLCLMAPYYAHAEEEHEEGEPVNPELKTIVKMAVNGKNFAVFDVYDHGEYYTGKKNNDGEFATEQFRDLFPGEEKAIATSMKYIADMVGSPANTLNMNLKLFYPEDANASAVSNTWIRYDNNEVPIQISDTELTATYLGKKRDENEGVAEITVNQADKWYTKKFPVLPSNGTDSDYYGTITHEMFHALGLGTYIRDIEDKEGKVIAYEFGTDPRASDDAESKYNTALTSSDSDRTEEIIPSQESTIVFNKYEMGLRDVFGRVAYYSGDKTYDEAPLDPNNEADWQRISGELKSRRIVGISVSEYNDIIAGTRPKLDGEFYVLRGSADEYSRSSDNVASRVSNVNNTPLADNTIIFTNGGAYFTGKHVEEVLTTNGELAQIAWPDGSLVPAVPGLPINGYQSYNDAPELSHIELQNSVMSHQNYRNWCTFMEAEIALLQDLGYTIDRSKYFGKSIYNSGTSNKLFKVNNDIGFNSTQTHGIGLHVYGSYVDVTQNAALHADGVYGIGIRVDGVGNKVTINSDVSANGKGGNGLLVAYGKKHNITLNAGKTIEATGTDGVAARFDFGSNELGDKFGYRGSYINVKVEDSDDNNEIDEDENTWIQAPIPSAINGELVSSFNVAGNLKGKYAAIYISPNALVKNINILKGADIQGDIISDWNPNKIIYQNGSGILAPDFGDTIENGHTNLTFGGKYDESTPAYTADSGFNMTYGGKIEGANSIDMRIAGGTLNYNGSAKVKSVNINAGATLSGKGSYELGTDGARGTFTNKGIFDLGDGIAEIKIKGNYEQTDTGNLKVDFNSDAGSDKLTISDSNSTTIKGKVTLTPQVDYYFNDQKITINVVSVNGAQQSIAGDSRVEFNNISPVLIFSLNDNESNAEKTKYVINVSRVEQGYQNVADDKISAGIGSALDNEANKSEEEQLLFSTDKKNLLTSLDFVATSGNTDKEKKNMMGSAIKKLNPNVAGSSAQATLVTNTALNNVTMMNTFRTTNSTAPIKLRSGRGPRREEEEQPKYNSWRNSVTPFAAYTNQHNGSSGYTNHNSGVIGSIERTLENGLTHGYHAAINHQSTQDSGSTIKGEGIYVGSQAAYAPVAWKGWEIFGSARLGVEQMRSRRAVYIGGGAPYYGTADANWTGYSGSLNIGTGYTMEHGVLRSGPFASLEYSFAHRPSVHEKGGAIRTNLESATYDSLRTQLGYRLTTKPKGLHSYDNTQWQAHASVAWNHELTSDNGRTSYELAEFPSTPIEDTIETYGRDSLSIAAGITFKTPKRLDVDLTLGSDIYRKGGSSVYGQVKFEWKI